MKLKSISTLLLFTCLCCRSSQLYGQIENADALPKQFDLLGQEPLQWMQNLLQSSATGLREMALYQGFALNWMPRGLPQNGGHWINGLNWSSNLSGWDPGFSYAGLYGGIRTQQVNNAYEINAFGLSGQAGTSYSATNPALFSKAKSITSRISNATSMQEIRIQLHTGKSIKPFSMNLEAIYQKTPAGYLANGLKERKGFLWAIEKTISMQHQLHFSFWWSPVVQGKRAPTVHEMFVLSKDPLYNPSWGWKAGQAFYVNTKKSNAPVLSFQYEFKNNKGNTIQLNLGAVLGTQSTTQLDWSKSTDPRPDYYKYLPSFATDPALKIELTNRFISNPALLQIQFDELIQKNTKSKTGAAQYIINERVQQLQLLRAAVLVNKSIGLNHSWSTGLHLKVDKIHYTNRVADLLGAQFYFNYNTWVNDEGLATAFQNDIESPDRKIKLNETWGAAYALYNQSIQAWTSMVGATRLIEWGIGFQLGLDQMQRKGYNQNGLYPTISKGISAWALFPTQQYQAYIRYKFNGRWYLTTRIFQSWEAPTANELYTNPSNHALHNPFLLPLVQTGTEIKLQMMGSNFKANASFYRQVNQNERQYKLFYHDFYNAFVSASAGQIKTIHQGFESFIETNWSSPIQLSMANSYGWFQIANQPLYEIRLSDNLYKVQSGSLLLKNFPATAYPQAVQAITLNYQPTYALRFSYSLVYASRRAISQDLFRRSSWTKENVEDENAWKEISAIVWAPDQWVSNLFVSKSFQLPSVKNKISLRLTGSIRNLLDVSIPSLVFEQSRFDYKNFNLQKFPTKQINDLGRTYTIGVQIISL
jgi:hypothetical protein